MFNIVQSICWAFSPVWMGCLTNECDWSPPVGLLWRYSSSLWWRIPLSSVDKLTSSFVGRTPIVYRDVNSTHVGAIDEGKPRDWVSSSFIILRSAYTRTYTKLLTFPHSNCIASQQQQQQHDRQQLHSIAVLQTSMSSSFIRTTLSTTTLPLTTSTKKQRTSVLFG